MELVVAHIENKIFTIRGVSVMIDRDLAELYQVETKVLNQAVKRNAERFPEAFRFQLNKEALTELVTNCDRFAALKHSSSLPYAFTEQGVAMLSAVLRSDIAVKVSIQIMQAFVMMRKSLGQWQGLIQRLDGVEMKQLRTDAKLEKVLSALERDITPRQGVFFEGQLFDAHVFASELIRNAGTSITLVDNYADETTLLLLSKRKPGVRCSLHTRIRPALNKDLEKHNQQYPAIAVVENRSSHDRFLILDDCQLYHIGASLKDLGNKCFGFSRMDEMLGDVKTRLLNCTDL